MRVLPLLMLVAMLALLTSACGTARSASAENPASTPREVTVNATEMVFSPATIDLKVGQPVKLTIKNNGMVEHTWQTQVNGEAILLTAPARQSVSKTFTPQTAGTYKVVCTEPGHEQAGMVGTLTVR